MPITRRIFGFKDFIFLESLEAGDSGLKEPGKVVKDDLSFIIDRFSVIHLKKKIRCKSGFFSMKACDKNLVDFGALLKNCSKYSQFLTLNVCGKKHSFHSRFLLFTRSLVPAPLLGTTRK